MEKERRAHSFSFSSSHIQVEVWVGTHNNKNKNNWNTLLVLCESTIYPLSRSIGWADRQRATYIYLFNDCVTLSIENACRTIIFYRLYEKTTYQIEGATKLNASIALTILHIYRHRACIYLLCNYTIRLKIDPIPIPIQARVEEGGTRT